MIRMSGYTACAALVLSAALVAGSNGASAADMSVAQVVKSAKLSIGRIIATLPYQNGKGEKGRSTSTGTGFVLDQNGNLVTNCHVVTVEAGKGNTATGAMTVDVIFPDQPRQHLPGRVLGCDKAGDIAVVHVEGLGASRPALRFADMSKVDVGEDVVAIGFARALPDQASVTRGIVSALHRSVDDGKFGDLVQTDAAVNHGNSGGPLLNLQGEVVGINTYGPSLTVKLSDVTEATSKTAAHDPDDVIPVTTTGYNMYYARGADSTSFYARQIVAHGAVPRPDFGVTVTTVYNPEQYNLPIIGIPVTAVAPGSLADKKGLRKDDMIYAVEWADGHQYATPDEGSLNDALARIEPGQSVKFRIVRFTEAGVAALLDHADVPATEYKWMYTPLTAPKAPDEPGIAAALAAVFKVNG